MDTRYSNRGAILGLNPGSTGTATVTGTNSKWDIFGDIHVGYDGSGQLTVTDGGSVSAWTLFASQSDLAGNGTISAKGAVIDGDLFFDSGHGLTQAIPFGTGGVVNLTVGPTGIASLGAGYRGTGRLRIADGLAVYSHSGYLGYQSGSSGTATVTGIGSKWSSTYSLSVGYHGAGNLNIEAGGQVSNDTAYLGNYSGSSGTAIVTGTNSSWSTGDLYVGYGGSGKLTVADGGSVSAKTLFGSLSDLSGNGTISAKGAVLDGEVFFDSAHGGLTPTIAFGTGGALSINVDPGAFLGAGYKGAGTLRIADGLALQSTYGYLGYWSGSSGTATVTGAGSAWTYTGTSTLYVGKHGAGTLNIEAGGRVTDSISHLGDEADGIGTVTVTGTGSKWESVHLYLGSSGAGTVKVEAGGQVSGSETYLANMPGSTGTATVTGPGSTWTNSGNMYSGSIYVGRYGAGTLKVEAGGQVNDNWGYLGCNPGATGTASVTGPGSKWSNKYDLYVGSDSSLSVADGGQATARSLIIASQSAVRVHVSGDSMLVLGSTTTAGSVTNSGSVNLYADAFLPADVYTPITESAGRSITWSGAFPLACGGTWDSGTMTFAVPAATETLPGSAAPVSTGSRLLITDSASGKRVGASFGGAAPGTDFLAELMSGGELTGLAAMPGFEGSVLSAWDFATDVSGQVLLSFDIHSGRQDLSLWRLHDGTWTPYAADLMTYDSHGILSFTVSDFSGYAVSGFVPHAGDATHDDRVNVDDLGILASNYDTLTWATWERADFTNDGFVNIDDLGIMATNYDWAAGGTAVPEPATLALLALGVLLGPRGRASRG